MRAIICGDWHMVNSRPVNRAFDRGMSVNFDMWTANWSGSLSMETGSSLWGGATASGTIAALAAGATDATDISVGLDIGHVGVQSGTVTLALASDVGGALPAPLDGGSGYQGLTVAVNSIKFGLNSETSGGLVRRDSDPLQPVTLGRADALPARRAAGNVEQW
jgi:hypothetical protein